MSTRAPRTPRQIVTVAGLEGNYLQVAVGRKNIRVKPEAGGESFLVEASKVSKVDVPESDELPVREGMSGKNRATYNGDIVIVVRKGKMNSRVAAVGGTTTFIVPNDELIDHFVYSPEAEGAAEAEVLAAEEAAS